MTKLTAKQSAFVREYLICNNATQSAIKAGYSSKTANKIATRLLSNVGIQRAIEAERARLIATGRIHTPDQVLEDLTKIVRADIRKLFNEDGSIKNPHEIDDLTAFSLNSIKMHESIVETSSGSGQMLSRNYEYKKSDKVQALTQLAKCLGIGNDSLDRFMDQITKLKGKITVDLNG